LHDLILEILFFKGMAGQARWWAYANHTTRCRLDPILVQPSPAGVTLLCGQFAFNASAVLTGDDDGCVAVYGLRGFEPHPYDQVTVAALMHYRCQFCSYVASQLRDMLQMSQLNLCVADFRCFYGNYLKAVWDQYRCGSFTVSHSAQCFRSCSALSKVHPVFQLYLPQPVGLICLSLTVILGLVNMCGIWPKACNILLIWLTIMIWL